MDVTKFFNDQERANIQAAVLTAEKSTSGEIVPCVVAQSDGYDVAAWRGATFGALVAAAVAELVHLYSGAWGIGATWWILAPALIGGTLGFLAGDFVPFITRALVPPHERTESVHRRATAAFVENEVFATRDRTGILIFLSLFERRVVVLADSGINAKVEQKEWDQITAGIVAGIHAGQPGKALVEAIGHCGELLKVQGVEIRPDDTNELANSLRIEER